MLKGQMKKMTFKKWLDAMMAVGISNLETPRGSAKVRARASASKIKSLSTGRLLKLLDSLNREQERINSDRLNISIILEKRLSA